MLHHLYVFILLAREDLEKELLSHVTEGVCRPFKVL